MRIAILGRGRLGSSLEVLLPATGAEVSTWSRGQPMPEADLYWLCVPDRALSEVAGRLPVGAVALHSAGSRGAEALLPVPERAVLHPLMTFPGPQVGIPDLRGVPATVDGTPEALRQATEIGQALGLQILRISGDRRRYHAAATIASSHVASVFLSAARLLENLGLKPEEARQALRPLAEESLRRAMAGPSALTGPTVRGDRETESGHLQALSEEERASYLPIRALILKLTGATADGIPVTEEDSIVGR